MICGETDASEPTNSIQSTCETARANSTRAGSARAHKIRLNLRKPEITGLRVGTLFPRSLATAPSKFEPSPTSSPPTWRRRWRQRRKPANPCQHLVIQQEVLLLSLEDKKKKQLRSSRGDQDPSVKSLPKKISQQRRSREDRGSRGVSRPSPSKSKLWRRESSSSCRARR